MSLRILRQNWLSAVRILAALLGLVQMRIHVPVAVGTVMCWIFPAHCPRGILLRRNGYFMISFYRKKKPVRYKSTRFAQTPSKLECRQSSSFWKWVMVPFKKIGSVSTRNRCSQPGIYIRQKRKAGLGVECKQLHYSSASDCACCVNAVDLDTHLSLSSSFFGRKSYQTR